MWVLTGQDEQALELIRRGLRDSIGTGRIDEEAIDDIARMVLGEIQRQGFAVTEVVQRRYATADEIRSRFAEAIEQCLTWEAFKSQPDDELAEALIDRVQCGDLEYPVTLRLEYDDD